MTYNERVQAMAEKMAPVLYRQRSFSIPWEDNANKEPWIKYGAEVARIAVEKMAYVYTLANLPHYHMDETMLASGMGRINREMKELGLIPDNAQEGAQNG